MDLMEPFSPSMEGIAKSGETLRQTERRNNARIGPSQTGQREIDNQYEKSQVQHVQHLPFTRLLALPARYSFYDENAVEQEEQRSNEDDKAWRLN